MKNIFAFLTIITLIFVGYYLYIQRTTGVLNFTNNEITESALVRTQDFFKRQIELNEIKLDTTIFTDTTFTNRKVFSPKLNEEEVGKNSPFSPTL